MDATFKTIDGAQWQLRITPHLLGKVRTELKINLADLEGLAKAVDDPFLLGSVLWLLCEKQAQERGIDVERFSEGFDGDVIGQAVGAIQEAFVNFTPPDQRPVAKKLLQRVRELNRLQIAKAEGQLDDADPEQLLELLSSRSGSLPISSPAPSASPLESPST